MFMVEVVIWIAGLSLLLYGAFLIYATVVLHTSPTWDAVLAEAARVAERSLGIAEGDYSTGEASAVAELRRSNRAPALPAPERPDDLDLMCAVLNVPRTEELEVEIAQERDAQLDAAVDRHLRYFARVRPLRWRVRMWHLAGAVTTALRTIRAVRWLAPRARFLVSEGNQAIGRLTAVASIGALVVIPLLADPLSGSGATSMLAVFGLATAIATMAGVFVPVVASVRRLQAVLRKPVRFWVASLAVLAVPVVLLRIVNSPMYTRWQQAQLSRLDGIDFETGAPRVVAWAAFVAALLWAAWRAARWVRVRSVRRSERVAAVASASALVTMAALAVFASVGATAYAQASALMLAATVTLGSLAWCVVATLEWAVRLRRLTRAGIRVRRGWFRWWALPVWAAAALLLGPIVTALAEIDASGTRPAVQAVLAIATVLAAVWLVLGLPAATAIGLTVTARYVLRVDREHRAAQANAAVADDRELGHENDC
ncbi:hypothetical protein FA014_02775 [Cellulomonas hominis]|uniref:Uncharacterized protein n=1 Tax=Cellulomonas hominis TaxID=156981 RepID=A0A7Z8K2L0_9CELL|nr:hypothetical protein [Cellulomonas hominis]TKR27010.1 hypothetical protein FA014_02775 [Cellulomonas hominis]